jgi:hypothetical protein
MNSRWLLYVVTGRKPGRAVRRRRLPGSRGPDRSWRYRAWVRTLPSVVSGLQPCEAAHTGTDGGMRQKPSDSTCIPLTLEEHAEYHQHGKPAFEAKYGIQCSEIVEKLNRLWKHEQGDPR